MIVLNSQFFFLQTSRHWLELKLSFQGVKLTFFTGSHLAPKYFKLVANSKKLVVKIHTSYKEDTRMGHIQRERLPKSKMASSDDRFTFRNRECAGIW